jgi:CPA2 family monovalent cation:H+ antiporter-2
VEVTAPAILEIGALLLAAAAAGWISRRLGLPAVVGYLVVGFGVSPFTPGIVADPEQLHLFADIGVILLLFEVGIEIDVRTLRREQRGLDVAAPVQMVLSTLFGVVAGLVTGIGPLAGALLGLAVGYSSSVVVINITRSRRRTTDKPTEDALIGWAILQDVTGVVLTGVLVALIGAGDRPWFATMGGLVAFVALAVGAAWLLPRLLRAVHDEKDIFLVVTIGAGLAVAGLGGIVFQIPMALAAFIAGLAISESHEAAEARRRILPFRDLFAILFFVSIGSLINPALFFDALPWLGLVLLLLVAGKMLVVYALARLIRLRARPGQLTIGLGQIGEFSFVLASLGLATGVFDELLYTAILAAVAISIAASTILVRLFPRPGPGPDPEARREVPVRGAT